MTRATSREIHGGRPVALLLTLLLLLAVPGCLRGQDPGRTPGDPAGRSRQELAELTATPESAVELFLRSVRAIRWSAAAQFMHDETLERFYTTARMMAAADTSGEVSRYLVDTDSAGLIPMEPADVFARSIGATIDGMPGLMHSLYDRDDEVLGHVPEDDTTAHVVYRSTPRLSGAVSEVKVMQVRRADDGGWRVLWSDELEVLDAALRGVGR
jgi:hypothetical protein